MLRLLHSSRTCEAWNLCAELVLLHKFLFYTKFVKWLVIESCQHLRYSDYSGISAMFTQETVE